MDAINFSVHHAFYVSHFPFTGFEECQERLVLMEGFVSSPMQQERHDTLVESTYRWFENLGDFEEYVIVSE